MCVCGGGGGIKDTVNHVRLFFTGISMHVHNNNHKQDISYRNTLNNALLRNRTRDSFLLTIS